MKLPLDRVVRKGDGPLIVGAYSVDDILRANREHDRKYGWTVKFPMLYFAPPVGHVPGPPGLDVSNPKQDHERLILDWHAKLSETGF